AALSRAERGRRGAGLARPDPRRRRPPPRPLARAARERGVRLLVLRDEDAAPGGALAALRGAGAAGPAGGPVRRERGGRGPGDGGGVARAAALAGRAGRLGGVPRDAGAGLGADPAGAGAGGRPVQLPAVPAVRAAGRRARLAVVALTVGVALFLGGQTWRQVHVWRDGLALWSGAVAATPWCGL